jgi:hypothetical protein
MDPEHEATLLGQSDKALCSSQALIGQLHTTITILTLERDHLADRVLIYESYLQWHVSPLVAKGQLPPSPFSQQQQPGSAAKAGSAGSAGAGRQGRAQYYAEGRQGAHAKSLAFDGASDEAAAADQEG